MAAVMCASCNGVAGWFGTKDSTSTETTSPQTTALVRDNSINEANAYSDLFLDSAAVENFIRAEKLPGSDASSLRSFYLVRNYGYAWLASDGLTDEARSFWTLHGKNTDNGERKERFHSYIDTLLQNGSLQLAATDSMTVRTELGITAAFVKYAAAQSTGAINRSNFYRAVPAKKVDPMQWADSVLNRSSDTAEAGVNPVYTGLRMGLATYYDAAKKGGWQPLPSGTLRKGMSAPSVAMLKKRLAATRQYGADTTTVYNDSLMAAVRGAQRQFGLAETGIATDSLIQALNVPAEQRIAQILVNLNRVRWVAEPTDGDHIEVNIPSFMLAAYRGGQQVLSMPVVVGKDGAGTVSFRDSISQVIFNPTWNVPSSIVRNEIMPAMKSDPSYLKKRHMEVVSSKDSVPVIRQLPGGDNALGRVKFLFPNSYDIYLHDTPAKSLFDKGNRALSHGCIRVARPDSLAAFVLQGESGWDAPKIATAMMGDRQQEVKVSRPVPVSITYFTVWSDASGLLQFRNDVYGHDRSTMQKLFLHGG
ncbi:MAG: L,D-transpeptidase family protein [Flaviaesturariibacter sp.]|nr:L,D-transpeptidase family protein [Flaviaesturariibacter sp.]